MPTLTYFTAGFTTLSPPAQDTLEVSEDDLVRAAIRVGYSPAVTAGYQRPLLELLWRALMVLTNLEEHPADGTWRKSEAYRRLDASEKSAVSYFLGMTQATLTAERVLGFPELAHLDTVLALLGMKSKQSRPDLVAYDPATATTMLAMEAKGRTRSRGDAADKAKEQAKHLPPGVGSSSTIAVASVASFEKRGAWEALLIDPPGDPYEELRGFLSPGIVQLAYYVPLVQALRDPGADIDSDRSDSVTTVAHLPAGDLWLGVPTPVFDLLSNPGDLYDASDDTRTARGADLAGMVSQLPGTRASLNIAARQLPGDLTTTGGRRPDASEQPEGPDRSAVDNGEEITDVAAEDADQAPVLPRIRPREAVGFDGVTVELGDSWRRRS